MPAAEHRALFVSMVDRLATPVLSLAAGGKLKTDFPVECRPGLREERAAVTHLEALGRLLAGIAPFLEQTDLDAEEKPLRDRLVEQARQALDVSTDPASPAFLNFTRHNQPLVDTAFLTHALLRAPNALFHGLPVRVQANVLNALESSRVIRPPASNWLLFSAMVEAGLHRFGRTADAMRLDYAIKQHDQWYKGDGHYGDGPNFHADHYNSFVIQPMLLDVLNAVGPLYPDWQQFLPVALARARRYAEVQERSISPTGTYPPTGRSITYRCGAFQLLARLALQEKLPPSLSPAQVRCALAAVTTATLDAPGTFDDQGFLRIGLVGSQPDLGEPYISTGSLYLCSVALLPLGLPRGHVFWTAPDEPFTQQKLFAGQNAPADQAVA